jgi:signal transduction histidine kinase
METDRPAWRSRAWIVAVSVLVVLALALTTTGFATPTSAWTTLVAAGGFTIAVISWALIRTSDQRRHYEDELAAWAAERATQDERLRIARELHDLASHGLGLITVRAATARTVAGPEGEAERASALADVERISRQATTELRRMLAVLRSPGPAPLSPGDTLDELPAIVKAAGEAGITADLDLDLDELHDVSLGAQLTVCAVVRESLNNTLRHAGPAHARVTIRREHDTVVVIVQDDGPRPGWRPQPGAGEGLRGLHERVTTLDGTLHAEPTADGWLVTAHIPDRSRA